MAPRPSLFSDEEQVIARAEALLSPQGGPPGADGFADLLGQYKKLFRQSRRLVKMGDRMQGELNRLNERLARSEDKYRGIFESSIQGIYRSTPDGRLLDLNPAMARIFGYTSVQDMLARAGNIGERLFPGPRSHEEFILALGRDKELRDHPLKLKRSTGEAIWVEVNVRGVFDPDGRLLEVEGLVADVTEKRNLLKELQHLARRDGLTGLWNRRYFMELGGRETARSRRDRTPLSLVYFDVDHFKAVNDTHGHETGDRVLAELAGVAGPRLREVDVLGRMGGEEFAALLPGTGLEGAMRVAEKLRLAIAGHRVKSPAGPIRCTASFGVAVDASKEPSLSDLIRRADQAMYAAKRAGRNQVMYARDVHRPVAASG